jgi:hypothetical protein
VIFEKTVSAAIYFKVADIYSPQDSIGIAKENKRTDQIEAGKHFYLPPQQ